MSVLLTLVIGAIGVFMSLVLTVLMLVGSANSSPRFGAQLQALVWASLFTAAVGAVGAIVGLILRKPPVALTFAVVPVLASIVIFGLFFEASKADYEKLPPASTTTLVVRTLAMLLFGGGGLAMYYIGTREFIVQRAALKDARPITAQIIQSEVFRSTSKPDDDSSFSATHSYRPDVRFRYHIDGTTYESDLLRPTVIVQSFGSHESAAAELAPFPLGATVTAFYNPGHPDRAFLLQESSAGPVVFIVLGLLLTPIVYLVSRLF